MRGVWRLCLYLPFSQNTYGSISAEAFKTLKRGQFLPCKRDFTSGPQSEARPVPPLDIYRGYKSKAQTGTYVYWHRSLTLGIMQMHKCFCFSSVKQPPPPPPSFLYSYLVEFSFSVERRWLLCTGSVRGWRAPCFSWAGDNRLLSSTESRL